MATADLDTVLAHEDPGFAAAVRAVVTGSPDDLRQRLAGNPSLVRGRSASSHRSTLLHYVSSNGIEDELQLAPESIYRRLAACAPDERPAFEQRALDVARLLVDAGAEVDALCESYGGGPGATTLNLLVSSGHPQAAGMQPPLVRLLAIAGANLNGVDDSGSPLATAIGFAAIDAARMLAECGARVDNIVFAAALDRTDLLAAYVANPGTCDLGWFAVAEDPATAAEQAMVFAASSGAHGAMIFLLDHGVCIDANPPGSHWTATALHAAAATGQVRIVQTLIEREADPTIRDEHHASTPLEWAENCGHLEVANLLRPYAAERA